MTVSLYRGFLSLAKYLTYSFVQYLALPQSFYSPALDITHGKSESFDSGTSCGLTFYGVIANSLLAALNSRQVLRGMQMRVNHLARGDAPNSIPLSIRSVRAISTRMYTVSHLFPSLRFLFIYL